MQAYIINGVRNKKAKNRAALFQPLALVDIVISGHERASLPRISEIGIHRPYEEIPYNIVKSTIALFLDEVLLKSLKEQHPDAELYQFLQDALTVLDLHHGNVLHFHIYFLLQLSRYLGFYPQGRRSEATPVLDLQEGRFVSRVPQHAHFLGGKGGELLSQLLDCNFTTFHEVMIDKTERRQLLRAVVTLYQLHISSFGIVKSLEVLEALAE